MKELLTIRKDLVQKYFTREKLCDSDYSIMHHKFNTAQLSSNYEVLNTLCSVPQVFPSKLDFQYCFSSKQIKLITHCANEAHLFSSVVSEAEVKALFTCYLKLPLKSACNRRVAFFLDVLCRQKLISARW